MITEKINWLNSIEKEHFAFLRKDSMFPWVCTTSSHLLGSYFDDLKVYYGTYGPNQLFHSWVEYKGNIIDLVQFQFLTPKEPFKYYQKLTIDDLIAYAIKHQKAFLFSQEQEEVQHYHKIAEVVPIFRKFKKENDTYSSFIEEVEKSDVFNFMRWPDTLIKNGSANQTFKELIKEQEYRITKRFFTKWAIVK